MQIVAINLPILRSTDLTFMTDGPCNYLVLFSMGVILQAACLTVTNLRLVKSLSLGPTPLGSAGCAQMPAVKDELKIMISVVR